MLLTLTDHLTCPRCGPGVGLVLFMERAEERRVRTGALGCPVCRTQYPIAGRVADLRVEGEDRPEAEAEAEAWRGGGGAADGIALRVAGVLELGEGRGFVLVDGPRALDVAAGLAAVVPDVEPVVPIVAAERAAAAGLPVSAFLDAGALPVADRTMRGVAWTGGVPGDGRLRELVRVTRPTGRVLIETGGAAGSVAGVAEALERCGARVRARDATGVVAVVL